MQDLPKQRVSFRKKSADDFQWAKDTMDSLLSNTLHSHYNTAYGASDYDRMLSNYQLYNNIINQKDFERDCNPLGINVGQIQDIIRPYNKTYNKIQVLLGDELLRPFNYKVVLTNADGVHSKMAHRDSLLRSYIYSQIQDTIKNISKMYEPDLLEEGTKHILNPQEIERYMSTTYLEAREILGNKILNYLSKKLSLKELKNEGFKHALISSIEAVYLSIQNDEPTIEVLNPLNLFFHKSPETKYIQDSLYAGYRSYLTTGEILDLYSSYLTQNQIDDIEDKKMGSTLKTILPGNNASYGHSPFVSYEAENGFSTSSPYHIVEHIEWVSQKKVGFLTYTTEDGPQETTVSEDFIVPSYATTTTVYKAYGRKCKYYIWEDQTTSYSLEWGWVPEVWQGVRINHDIYCQIGPVPHQYRSADNPFEVKLSYHGVIYNATNAAPTSLMDRMKPFQYLYLIVMHRLKRLISQDKGKVYNLDSSMIDPELGWEKTLYYMNELNLNVYNSLQNADLPGQAQRSSIAGSTDMSNAQHIVNYVNLLEAIDQQISDVAGVTRQREGQINPQEAVSNAQSNIQTSAVITEIYFFQHNVLWEDVLSSLINMTQAAWKERSITKQYVLDDMSLATLQLSPSDLDNAQFSIFVTDSPREQRLFDNLQMLADRALQANKIKFSDLVAIYTSTSTEEIKGQLQKSEEAMTAELQQQQQQMIQAEQAAQEKDLAFKASEAEKDRLHDIKIAEIETFKFVKEQDSNSNGVPDQFEIAKFEHEAAMDKIGVAQKDRELDIKEAAAKKRATTEKN